MEAGTQGDVINPWAAAQFRSLKRADPSSPTQESAFDKWLEQTSGREQARNDRIHAATGVIPGPLWVVLIFSALAIFVYMLFFADRAERAVVQGMMIGTVAGVIVARLILIRFLDNPYHSGYASLKPVAMERTLELLDQARAVVGDRRPPPCNEQGAPL